MSVEHTRGSSYGQVWAPGNRTSRGARSRPSRLTCSRTWRRKDHRCNSLQHITNNDCSSSAHEMFPELCVNGSVVCRTEVVLLHEPFRGSSRTTFRSLVFFPEPEHWTAMLTDCTSASPTPLLGCHAFLKPHATHTDKEILWDMKPHISDTCNFLTYRTIKHLKEGHFLQIYNVNQCKCAWGKISVCMYINLQGERRCNSVFTIFTLVTTPDEGHYCMFSIFLVPF